MFDIIYVCCVIYDIYFVCNLFMCNTMYIWHYMCVVYDVMYCVYVCVWKCSDDIYYISESPSLSRDVYVDYPVVLSTSVLSIHYILYIHTYTIYYMPAVYVYIVCICVCMLYDD